MMYFHRYDILEAHYAFCADYHEGQSSRLYERLCRIGHVFRPGPLWNGRRSLSHNAQAIYDELVRRYLQ